MYLGGRGGRASVVVVLRKHELYKIGRFPRSENHAGNDWTRVGNSEEKKIPIVGARITIYFCPAEM